VELTIEHPHTGEKEKVEVYPYRDVRAR